MDALRVRHNSTRFNSTLTPLSIRSSLAIISFVYALSQSTTYTYEAYAASSFESHALIGTIGVIVSIIGGVGRPFIAKV
jgi:uncharacterized membrane protein YidH (DUF202 family)